MINLTQADSLKISTDTIAVAPAVVEVADSVCMTTESEQIPKPAIEPEPVATIVTRPVPIKKVEIVEEASGIAMDTAIPVIAEEYQPFIPFSTLNSNDSSQLKRTPQSLKSFQSELPTQIVSAELRNKVREYEKEWVLGVSIFVVVLLIIVRAYYQKHLSSIIASVFNIQLSDKLLREKNVLVRRVYFLLNLSYLVTLGLYFYQLTKRMNLQFSVESDFPLFLLILSILLGVIILRLIIAQFIAFVFDAVPVFREYLHNTFIINKNLGLYLFPVVISIVYVEQVVGDYLFILATIMLIISVLFRYLKGIQIILKHNIFLFYSILYLCTLEILPVLIGIKFVLER